MVAHAVPLHVDRGVGWDVTLVRTNFQFFDPGVNINGQYVKIFAARRMKHNSEYFMIEHHAQHAREIVELLKVATLEFSPPSV